MRTLQEPPRPATPPAPTAGPDVGVLKALADPHRLQLLALVRAAGGEACVCDLTAQVGLAQATVSHHLRVLVEAGLLHRERRGSWAWYRVEPRAVLEAAEALRALAEPPRPSLPLSAAGSARGCS